MNKLTRRSARSVAETPKPLPFVMVKIPFTLHQRAKSVMKDVGLNIPLHFLVQQSLSEELDCMTIGTAMNTSGAEEEVSELTRLWKEEEARVKANGMHHVEPAAEKLPIQTFMEFVRENSLELIQCWSGRGSTTRGICFKQHGSERIVFVDKGRVTTVSIRESAALLANWFPRTLDSCFGPGHTRWLKMVVAALPKEAL